MEAGLTIQYDRVGDILSIDKCEPYAEQLSDLLPGDIGVRLNPGTEEVETIEVMWLMRRLEAGERIEIPVEATLQLISDI